MKERKQLEKQLLHYMMLDTRYGRYLRQIGKPKYFRSTINKLKEKIAELDNETPRVHEDEIEGGRDERHGKPS